MLSVAVLGATGRMGREVVRAIAAAADCRLTGATVRPGADAGRDAGEVAGVERSGVLLSDSPATAIAGAEVAIDFTLASATSANLAACCASGCALVIGVTGHDESTRGEIDRAATRIPILLAANLSLGAGVLRRLAAAAAEALPEDYDVAILDFHHRHKRDAPSGTALALGDAVAASRPDRRKPGFAAVRAGDIVGDHTVVFAGRGERIELTHRVQGRSSFAAGALSAARWLAAQPPGLYGMDDTMQDGP
ncbi:MAG: 4-hydroxy-tetrahydrodipicolinate reductase [Gammaproteobacteria bacterium]